MLRIAYAEIGMSIVTCTVTMRPSITMSHLTYFSISKMRKFKLDLFNLERLVKSKNRMIYCVAPLDAPMIQSW
jgi:hypothetical protein